MGLDRQLSVFPSKANCDSHLTNKWHRQGWHAKLAMLKLVNEVTFVFFPVNATKWESQSLAFQCTVFRGPSILGDNLGRVLATSWKATDLQEADQHNDKIQECTPSFKVCRDFLASR